MLRVVGRHLLLKLDGIDGVESLLEELLEEDVFKHAHGGQDAALGQSVNGLADRFDEKRERIVGLPQTGQGHNWRIG